MSFLEFFQGKEDKRNLLLPDIVPTSPLSMYITGGAANKTIRFSTTFYNQGRGPLEIFGHTDKEKKLTYASQYVYEDGGPGLFRDMGTFVFHPAHNHWHVDEYVFYELWSVNGEGKADKILVTTDKMSFCIWDEKVRDLSIDGAAKTQAYPRTCNGIKQGMSVGWSDTYAAAIEGQEIDVTNIPDGTYIFRSLVNPNRRVAETNYDNNQVDVTIEIKGNNLVRK